MSPLEWFHSTEAPPTPDSLVVMELNGIIDSDWINKCGNTWKIIGIETETPLLQMDHYVFTGKFEDAVGTNVLFKVEKNHPELDRHMCSSMADQPTRLKYNSHTFKRLQMQRSFLTENDPSTPESRAVPKGEWSSVRDEEAEQVMPMETGPVERRSELSPAADPLPSSSSTHR